MAERPLTQEMLDRRSYGQGSRARFDPQWAMSRPEKWYTQSYDTGKSKIRNIDLIKDTLVRQPAVTTDPNESRNMYQMLMNQMKGGDRGARLIDTSGLPAVRAKEYNPFPKAGFGEQFYKDEFPISSGLGSFMEAAENFMPYFGMAKRMFSKEREPLERDPRFLPENNMAPFWELLEDKVEEEPDVVTDLVEGDSENDLTENFLANEKEEIPFEFNLGELMKDLASIKVNPAKAAQHGFEGSATELWTRAKEQSKQFGHDFSGEEVLERLFKEGWFNPDESIAVGDI
jgi:hypothetical protein